MDSKQKLDRIKSKIFSKQGAEKDMMLMMAEVMEQVGGYEAFLNLPVSAYAELAEAIEYRAELERKEIAKHKLRRG